MSVDLERSRAADALLAPRGIAETVVQRHYAADPTLEAQFGAAGRERCLEDVRFHLAFLAAAVRYEEVGIFDEYVAWLKSMLGARGIKAEHLTANLSLLATTLREELGPGAEVPCHYIQHALHEMQSAPLIPPSELNPAAPFYSVVADYMRFLQAGDPIKALATVRKAAAEGTSICTNMSSRRRNTKWAVCGKSTK